MFLFFCIKCKLCVIYGLSVPQLKCHIGNKVTKNHVCRSVAKSELPPPYKSNNLHHKLTKVLETLRKHLQSADGR